MSVKGTFLAGQWLRLHFLNSGAGFDFHMPQLRVCMPRLKILYTAIKKQIPHATASRDATCHTGD